MNAKMICVFLVLIWSVFFASCSGVSDEVVIHGTGEVLAQEYDISSFEELEISHFFEVEVIQGDLFQVVAETTEELEPYVEIVMKGKTLRIGMKAGYRYNFENATHRVIVTLPVPTRLSASGMCEVNIDEYLHAGELILVITEFSSLAGVVNVGRMEIEASEFAKVRLQGSAHQVKVDSSWNSSVNLDNFTITGDQAEQNS